MLEFRFRRHIVLRRNQSAPYGQVNLLDRADENTEIDASICFQIPPFWVALYDYIINFIKN